MLTASRLKSREGTTIIAGKSGGRKILCSNRALPAYNNLVSLSQGNYWATLIVKSIVGLTSGRLSKDNIYIKKGTSIAYGKGDAFYLVLPGVTASLEEHPNGGFILQTLNIDKSYEEQQKNAKKPGLWRIDQKASQETAEFISDGRVTKRDIRPVVISDMSNSALLQVVNVTYQSLMDVEATKGSTQNYGFDLHFTPGGSGIMGLKKAKDAISTDKDKKIVQSAMLLANTMYQAHKQKGVIWFSDYGGSAILTRALQILQREPGVSLENHSIYMNHPTSMSKEAIAAAKALNLTEFDKKSGILNPKEFIGHFTLNEKMGSKTVKASLGGLSAAGAAFGFAGASLTTAGLVGLAGGLVFVGKAIVDGAKNTKLQKY